VPPRAPGTTMRVPHPHVKGVSIAVNVPASARVGQAMLVPIPDDASLAGTSPSKGRPGKASSLSWVSASAKEDSLLLTAQGGAHAESRPAEAATQETPPAEKTPAPKASGGWSYCVLCSSVTFHWDYCNCV